MTSQRPDSQPTEAITKSGEASCEHAWPFTTAREQQGFRRTRDWEKRNSEIESRLGGFGLGGSRAFTRFWLAGGREFAFRLEPIFYLVAGSAAAFEKNFVST